jgi:hypothetical protein
MKQPNKVGGGANTNANGLLFEQTTSLEDVLRSLPNVSVINDKVIKQNVEIGVLCGKGGLYSKLLKPNGIDSSTIISKKLLPDEAFYNYQTNTLYIIEKKFQNGSGSVDEKLQTCHFKKRQYTKLMDFLGIKVEYIYVLNDWFKRSEYRDVHEYIQSVGCHYYFNQIPLNIIGL